MWTRSVRIAFQVKTVDEQSTISHRSGLTVIIMLNYGGPIISDKLRSIEKVERHTARVLPMISLLHGNDTE